MQLSPDILCVGALHWDVIGRAPGVIARGDDLPGRIVRQPGGVALNIARVLGRLGMTPALLGMLGRDREGDDLLASCDALGLITDHIHRAPHLGTGCYVAIEDTSGLVAALADAHGLEAAGDAILPPLIDGALASAARPWQGPVVIDGNLTEVTLARIAAIESLAAADLRLVPASPAKAQRLAFLLRHPGATFYLNRAEAEVLAGTATASAVTAVAALLGLGAARVLVTDGGDTAAFGTAAGIVMARPPTVRIGRVTGAGDTLLAAHIVAERDGLGAHDSLIAALAAASAFVADG